MSLFLGYFLVVILMLLFLAILFMTDCKVYAWHITTVIFAFIPIINWLILGAYLMLFVFCILDYKIEFKSNKVTKFLFNK